MRRVKILSLGILSGTIWYGVSLLLFPHAYAEGILGSSKLMAVLAGVITGIFITVVSIPVYRMPSRHLFWYSPLSVYLAVAIYGTLIFFVRAYITSDYPSGVRLSEKLYEMVIGMWWAITFMLQGLIVVQLLAYINHRALRGAFAT